MRDYAREMIEAWTNNGEQAAYDLGQELLAEIQDAFLTLKRHESAIQALGMVLQDHGDVDPTAADPVEPEPGLDTIEPSERPRLIIEGALEVLGNQQNWGGSEANLVKTVAVLDVLQGKGLDLGVQQPLAVIGTVLTNAENFTKVARNTFEYSQPPSPSVRDDLPW